MKTAEWIEVENQMPTDINPVLIWIPEHENVYMAFRYWDKWNMVGAGNKIKETVTHWMPLPNPPIKAQAEISDETEIRFLLEGYSE